MDGEKIKLYSRPQYGILSHNCIELKKENLHLWPLKIQFFKLVQIRNKDRPDQRLNPKNHNIALISSSVWDTQLWLSWNEERKLAPLVVQIKNWACTDQRLKWRKKTCTLDLKIPLFQAYPNQKLNPSRSETVQIRVIHGASALDHHSSRSNSDNRF